MLFFKSLLIFAIAIKVKENLRTFAMLLYFFIIRDITAKIFHILRISKH